MIKGIDPIHITETLSVQPLPTWCKVAAALAADELAPSPLAGEGWE